MILLHLSCRLGGVAEGRMTEMESDSIMLEAPALSAQRVVGLIVPSVGAHAATEPGECSSPAPPPWGVLPTMSSDSACAAVASGDAQEQRTHAAGAQARSAQPGIASSQRPLILLGIATQLGSQLGSCPPKGPRRPHAQTRPASAEHVAQISKAPAITERLQRLPRRRRRPRSTHVVGVHGSADHGIATPAPPLATGPPHITASRTTPAHTHPCSTHLHLHRTHHALLSPSATRSPLPLKRPCPS